MKHFDDNRFVTWEVYIVTTLALILLNAISLIVLLEIIQ